MKLFTTLLLLITVQVSAQELHLFELDLFDGGEYDKCGFVSVSDIHQLSEDPDSSAIPDMQSIRTADAWFIELNDVYRNRFLQNSGILETDQLFIYDYDVDRQIALKISEVKVVASLTVFTAANKRPHTQEDYQFGFLVDKVTLDKLSQDCYRTFAAVGSQSPFITGKLEPIHWKRTENDALSKLKVKSSLDSLIEQYNYSKAPCQVDSVHFFSTKTYLYYAESVSGTDLNARHLVVLDAHSKAIVCERLFLDSEGAELSELNDIETEPHPLFYDQWTGLFLKNFPPVVFGFEVRTFGCASISFLDLSVPDLELDCDKWH